jgi:hypothetical protein
MEVVADHLLSIRGVVKVRKMLKVLPVGSPGVLPVLHKI